MTWGTDDQDGEDKDPTQANLTRKQVQDFLKSAEDLCTQLLECSVKFKCRINELPLPYKEILRHPEVNAKQQHNILQIHLSCFSHQLPVTLTIYLYTAVSQRIHLSLHDV